MALGFGDAEDSRLSHWARVRVRIAHAIGILLDAKKAAEAEDSTAPAWHLLEQVDDHLRVALKQRSEIISHEVKERTRRRHGTKVEW